MKKFFKITGIILAVVTVLLLVLYVYIVNNAEHILQDFVASQSDGKMSLKIKKVKFDARTLHLEVFEPHFYSNDTLTAITTYDIKVKKLVLEISALKPLIFERKIHLDTIMCNRPQIIVTKWRDQPKDQPKEKFSLPEQMGKVYGGLENALEKLNIKYCLIDSGSFSLVNKLTGDLKPVTISDFYLKVQNLTNDTASAKGNRYLFTDRIKFQTIRQDIVFPGGKRGIKYSRLLVNSLTQSIELDSCYIYGKKDGPGVNEFGVFFDTLRITKADLGKFIHSNVIQADTAICINPEIRMEIEMPEKSNLPKTRKPRLSNDSMEMVIRTLFGDLDIHYIGVLNARANVKTRSKDKNSTFSTEKVNFSLQDIAILSDTAIPIKFGSLTMGLYGYQTYNGDSTYLMSFDSILFRNNRVDLSNFSIAPTPRNRNFINRKKLTMHALEIQEISWFQLFLNKQIVATEMTLYKPGINIVAPKKKQSSKSKPPSTIYDALSSLSHLVKVDRIIIADGHVDFYGGKNHLKLQKVNADIGIKKLLHASNINDMTGSVDKISFAEGSLYNGKNTISFQNGFFNGRDQFLTIGRVRYSVSGGGSSAIIEDFRVDEFNNETDGQINFGNLSWRKASIEIQPPKTKNATKGNTASSKKAIQIGLKKLDGKNTSIAFKSDNLNASVFFELLHTNNIEWDGKNKPNIQGLKVKGNSLKVKSNTADISVKDFMIGDQQSSFLNQLKIITIGKKDTVSINSSQFSFAPNINSTLNGVPTINNVILKDPVISFNSTGDTTKSPPGQKKGTLPKLEINQLSIINPGITKLPSSVQKNMNVANQKSSWQFTGIKSDGKKLTIAGIRSAMSGFSLDTKKMSLSVAADGKFETDLSGINYSPATTASPASWAATVGFLTARNVDIATKRNDSIQSKIQLHSLDVENLSLGSGGKSVLNELLAKNKSLVVKNGSVSMVNAKNDLVVKNLAYYQSSQRLSFDSLSVKPPMDKDSFNRVNIFAKDYIEFSTGKTSIDGIDPALFLNDSIFYARNITTTQPVLQLYKDKRLPSRPAASYRDLPVSRLQQSKKKIQVDSVYLVKADIAYRELNNKTGMVGIVQFKRTDILVEGIKTFNYLPTDSFRLKAVGTFMDSAHLRFRFSESYTDTLHAFLMHVRLSPFNLTALNPLLSPLVSLKIKNGWLDTLHMSAIGREYIAMGKMRMYYSGLQAQYLIKGDDELKTLKTRVINFAANNLVLKKKNKTGYGKVYAERKRGKNIFNYWIKMILSGAISSTGVQSNKKQEKKYDKSVEKLKVPEIPEVDL